MTNPSAAPSHAPHQSLPAERYVRAERFLPWNAARLTFGMGIDPQWIDDGDGFWFRSETAGGPRYCRVDPGGDAVRPAFDHVGLAAALSRALSAPVDPDRLDLQDLTFQQGPERVTFTSRRPVMDLSPGRRYLRTKRIAV